MASSIEMKVAVVEKKKEKRLIKTNGMGHIYPGDHISISLKNNGTNKVYVHVFNVNVAGKISLVTCLTPLGISLAPGATDVIGKNEFGIINGVPVSWPKDIPRVQSVVECLVAIQT
ncbi:hypothetical protein HD806DRAFT_530652 [Xylariaceae sp. AK1471]|nr:hypothetical protein HD806DRAFT_530652 [Xylariaceae sp. AK1471]